MSESGKVLFEMKNANFVDLRFGQVQADANGAASDLHLK